MVLGKPSISDPRAFDLRAFQAAVSNVRQRIEVLEAAVQALQNVSGSAMSIALLQAQIASLQRTINALVTPTAGSTDIVFVDVPGDHFFASSDFTENRRCLSTSGTSGDQVLVLQDDGALEADVGALVRIYVEGEATVSVVAVSGVALRVRSGLSSIMDGQYSVASLFKRRANEWVLTGDLAGVSG